MGMEMHAESYEDFLNDKEFKDVSRGFVIDLEDIHKNLFDFQKVIVRWALKRGRAAIFADTGLGKTRMQCEWAKHVHRHTGQNVLIVAPLCVAEQTIQEAKNIDMEIVYARETTNAPFVITNYEMLKAFDLSQYCGIVLDESSILKHSDSKTRKQIIDITRHLPYRLSCTATPSPNDFMELGNQAEFIGIMSCAEMLATFFTHDGGETSKWRLKGHGKTKFWEWMATWSICIRSPEDLGYDGSQYVLPDLNLIDVEIESKQELSGVLFPDPAASLSEHRKEQRRTIHERCEKTAQIVNASNEPFIVWCFLNDESNLLKKLITDAVVVTGSDPIEHKKRSISDFTNGKARVIITKSAITGFGMNWQHCHNMVFCGISHSFEQFYQSVRRCYRFGQTNTNSSRDMGNCVSDEQFFKHFKFLVEDLFRVIKPGRLLSFHCMNLPTNKFRDGFIGIRDFRGELIRAFTSVGFIYHSEVVIWKDPVTAMQRTKALGLLHKQLKKDSAMCRQGIPDYLVTMRKPGENPEPISHTDESFPVSLWQRYASPVWMDINPSNTLQFRTARENDDERHICPLQLQVIERALDLWTNPNDTVLSPFMGIGSEGYVAIKKGRRFIGIELKKSYFDLAIKNLEQATKEQTLF